LSLLLDTQAIIWLATSPDRIPSRVKDAVADADASIFVSFVSAWEYGIKRARHPAKLPLPFERLLMPDYQRLGISFDLHRFSEELPDLHRDPFDRMLVAQAMSLDLTLVTVDAALRRYPVRTLW
jgi:PIN domain nuclease of toxin-antitoxin system